MEGQSVCCIVAASVGSLSAFGWSWSVYRRRKRAAAQAKLERDFAWAQASVAAAAVGGLAYEEADARVKALPVDSQAWALGRGYADAVYSSIDRGDLDAYEAALLNFGHAFHLGHDNEYVRDAEAARFHAPAVASILAGVVPEIDGTVMPAGIVLGARERFVWSGLAVGTEVTQFRRTRFESAGIGVRVARGVYFRTGTGQSVSQTFQTIGRSGHGCLAITTKHVIFAGGASTLRIPYGKILRVVSADDGIALELDWATRPLFLAEMPRADAWLAANLIANMPQAR